MQFFTYGLLLKFAEALHSDFNEVVIVPFPSPWKREPTAPGDTGHGNDAGAQRCKPTVRSGTQFCSPARKETWEKRWLFGPLPATLPDGARGTISRQHFHPFQHQTQTETGQKRRYRDVNSGRI